jgi:hypothetical protein
MAILFDALTAPASASLELMRPRSAPAPLAGSVSLVTGKLLNGLW